MAIAHPAHSANDCCELGKTQLRLNRLLSLPSRLPTIPIFFLAMGLAGCAQNSAQREFNPVQREARAVHARSFSHAHIRAQTQHVELRVRRPDAKLLTPQPAPNCEFNRADIKAVDPDEWARLKTEYERQCYQDAEKAARERLGQLQGSSTCEVERIPQRRPASSRTHSRDKVS